MGWGTSFLLYFKVIHFTCLIFVNNNCFQDHRIIKSVMDRLISIFCILATSGITCLVSIASQIKDIVLFKVQVTQIFGFYIFSYFKNMGSNRGFHKVFLILLSPSMSKLTVNIGIFSL